MDGFAEGLQREGLEDRSTWRQTDSQKDRLAKRQTRKKMDFFDRPTRRQNSKTEGLSDRRINRQKNYLMPNDFWRNVSTI